MIQRIVPYRYVVPYLRLALQDARAFFYGRKRFVTKKRIDFLRVSIDGFFESGGKGVDPSDFAERLHGELFFLHPEYETELEKIHNYLRVLGDGGLLTEVSGGYFPTGLAIEYVKRYDQEERRHKAVIFLHRIIAILTFLLVVATAFQAKLIKVPTFWKHFVG